MGTGGHAERAVFEKLIALTGDEGRARALCSFNRYGILLMDDLLTVQVAPGSSELTGVKSYSRLDFFFGVRRVNFRRLHSNDDELAIFKHIAPVMLDTGDELACSWLSAWTYAFAGAFAEDEQESLSAGKPWGPFAFSWSKRDRSPEYLTKHRAYLVKLRCHARLVERRARVWVLLISLHRCMRECHQQLQYEDESLEDSASLREYDPLSRLAVLESAWDPAVCSVWQGAALPANTTGEEEAAGLDLLTHAMIVGDVATVKVLQAKAGAEVVGPTPELVLQCAMDAHATGHLVIAKELRRLSLRMEALRRGFGQAQTRLHSVDHLREVIMAHVASVGVSLPAASW